MPEPIERLPHLSLSKREMAVFLALARGRTVAEIARTTFRGPQTISTQRHQVLAKMKVKTNADLTAYALHHGLVDNWMANQP
jgi:two-component system invasion response regulator UvrY